MLNNFLKVQFKLADWHFGSNKSAPIFKVFGMTRVSFELQLPTTEMRLKLKSNFTTTTEKIKNFQY